MKNTIATLALIAATATSVSAQNAMNNSGVVGSPTDFTWDGVATLPDRCEFHTGNTNGKMQLQADELTWLVTEPAQIGLRVRGLSNVWIENDGQFIGSDGMDFPAVVDYEGERDSTGLGASYYSFSDNDRKNGIYNTGAAGKVTVNVNERDGDMYITLGGAAYAQPGTKFRTGVSYKIVHTITCID